MPDNAFLIKPDMKLTIAIDRLEGRFRVTLDNTDNIFDVSNLVPPITPEFRILREGNHKLDLTASNHGDTSYDVQFRISVEKPDDERVYSSYFRFQCTGEPGDTTHGETLNFSAQ